MDEATLRRRIEMGEDSTIEFKGVARGKRPFHVDGDAVAKSVCALANTAGGFLVVGVEKSGEVTGTGSRDQRDALMRQTTQAIHDRLKLLVKAEFVPVGDQVVIVVQVPEYLAGRPYLANGKPYYRDGNRTRVGTAEELRRSLQSVAFHHDAEPLDDLDADALDPAVVGALQVRLLVPGGPGALAPLDFAEIRGLTRDGHPTVAGLLTCGKLPQRRLPSARISAARFAGHAITDPIADRLEIEGRIGLQIDAAETFVLANTSRPGVIEGMVRRDAGLPSSAIREAVVNALVHRDYQIGAQVQLRVFDDRVEVTNPGGLLNAMTVERMLRGYRSVQRNTFLARLAVAFGYSEMNGRGVQFMLQSLSEAGLPPPRFEADADEFRITLPTKPAA